VSYRKKTGLAFGPLVGYTRHWEWSYLGAEWGSCLPHL